MNDDNQSETDLEQWLGKIQWNEGILTADPATALAATLNRECIEFGQGDALPSLWHWLYFLKPNRLSQLAADGHPKKGDFLPPISLPRRMWAGSRLTFIQPLHIGESVSKKSTIKSLQFKQGRSGKLGFVCVSHEINNASGMAIIEEQDLVYRGAALPSAPDATRSKSSETADFSMTISPDPVLLFRYSALTFNAHRIHYDRQYAVGVEGYPALVVHGPLLATLMLELAATELAGYGLAAFEFRALQPVFDNGEILVCGKQPDGDGKCLLWVENAAGEVCMQGKAVLQG